jgi:hypothetical protein
VPILIKRYVVCDSPVRCQVAAEGGGEDGLFIASNERRDVVEVIAGAFGFRAQAVDLCDYPALFLLWW